MVAQAKNNQADRGRTGGVVAFPSLAETVNVNEALPDMRGIRETAERFGLPVHFIRELIRTGKVYAVQAGSKKFYINQDSVIAYLTGTEVAR